MGAHTIVIDFQEPSIEKVEAQIRVLHHYIQRLGVARNALLPINRLPPDVLLDIFALVGKTWDIHATRSMLKLTWVSHRWREFALSCPSLWTVITDSNLNRTKRWLARSRSVPLSVGLFKMGRNSAISNKLHLQSLAAQMPRIKTLHICQTDREVLFELTTSWNAPALLLTSLKLKGVGISGNFLSQVPNVRDLFLARCKFSWEAGAANFTYLTSLYIIRPQLAVPVGQFIALLHNTPSLERVVLIEAFSLDGYPEPTVLDQPPALKRARLHMLKTDTDNFGSGLQFLKHVGPRFTTSETVVSCSFDHMAFEDSDAGTLPLLLSTFSQLSSTQVVTTISLEDDLLSINYRNLDYDMCQRSLHTFITQEQFLALSLTLKQTLRLTHLQAFRFDLELFGWDVPHLIEVFGRLPSLEYFDFQGGCHEMTVLLNALALESSPTLFPALKIFGTLSPKEVRDLLPQVLITRKRLGCGFKTVILHGGDEADLKTALRMLGHLVDHFILEDCPETEGIRHEKLGGTDPVFDECYTKPFDGSY
ncbi:hypothetical protein BDN72DRAFT_965374 [Pluteus cervinus]|uniref:Uncharacterized protein n=1 Tax=Pluteus cervinus TaxID=181527 RepID=A0ACD3A5Y5_9AGAR|nr:hypothetical protein BDN72DRAFT_965374 [Pluteus cervinus]